MPSKKVKVNVVTESEEPKKDLDPRLEEIKQTFEKGSKQMVKSLKTFGKGFGQLVKEAKKRL